MLPASFSLVVSISTELAHKAWQRQLKCQFTRKTFYRTTREQEWWPAVVCDSGHLGSSTGSATNYLSDLGPVTILFSSSHVIKERKRDETTLLFLQWWVENVYQCFCVMDLERRWVLLAAQCSGCSFVVPPLPKSPPTRGNMVPHTGGDSTR